MRRRSAHACHLAVLGFLLGLWASPLKAAPRTGGFTRELQLKHGAFSPPGVPNAVVHAGPAFEPTGPIDVLIFLHGFRGCARAQVASSPRPCGAAEAVPGRHLGDIHRDAGTNTLLVVPQLKLMQRDGSPGRFARRGGFTAFLDELLNEGLSQQLGPRARARVRTVALLAHSAGYRAALAILESGDEAHLVRDVVLLDALYGGAPRFAAWLLDGERRRLISLHAGRGKTARFSQVLARRLERQHLERIRLSDPPLLPAQNRPFRWAVEQVTTPHALFPQAHLVGLLQLLFPPVGQAQPSAPTLK